MQQALSAGFSLIGTPILAYYQTLIDENEQGETSKQVYRFRDHGKRDVGLRYDLTVPFARFVAEHQGELQFPFKCVQFGEVFRGEKPQKGRYRQFCQCDFDIVGADNSSADAEIIALCYNILAALAVGKVKLAISDRQILLALVGKVYPALDKGKLEEVLIVVDKYHKIGKDMTTALIAETTSSSVHLAEELLALLKGDEADVRGFFLKEVALLSSVREVAGDASKDIFAM